MEFTEEQRDFIQKKMEEVKEFLCQTGIDPEQLTVTFLTTVFYGDEDSPKEDANYLSDYEYIVYLDVANVYDSDAILDILEDRISASVAPIVRDIELGKEVEDFFDDKDTSNIDFWEKISKKN